MPYGMRELLQSTGGETYRREFWMQRINPHVTCGNDLFVFFYAPWITKDFYIGEARGKGYQTLLRKIGEENQKSTSRAPRNEVP